jgi:hypothetical protein
VGVKTHHPFLRICLLRAYVYLYSDVYPDRKRERENEREKER